MKKGDRVSFGGRVGTITGFMPAGMVDVRFDDAPGRIERRHTNRLGRVARPNGRKRRARKARRNSSEREAARLRQAEAKMRQTTKPKEVRLDIDVRGKLQGRGATMFTREDPPRLSADRKTYCGNPIDATAYYIVVDNSRRWVPRWVTKSEVQRAAPPGAEGQELLDWFRDSFIPSLDAQRGAEVMAVPLSARKFIKLRGGKRGAASPSKMLKDPDLLIKQRKVGPVGAEPDPAVDFSLPDPETGGQVFFRVSQWRAPGPEKLQRFQAFSYRRFIAPAPNTLREASVERWGALSMALHEASKSDRQLAPMGIHPQVCQWLIRSAAVSINRVIELDPYSTDFQQGLPITVQLKDKSKSPFFGWVPAVVPLSDKKHLLSPCLSGEDLRVRKELRVMGNVLGGFNGALNQARGLFRRLAEQPATLQADGRRNDVMRTVTKLANAYAGLVRWYSRLEERYLRGDTTAYRVAQTFLSSALEPGNPASPFSKAKSAFRTTPGMRGLISGDWLVEQVRVNDPKKLKRELAKLMRQLQRQGNEVEIINEDSGIFRSRTPPSEARSHITDANEYAEFMQGLRARVGALKSQLGESALSFFEGTQPLPHPMDDLFQFVEPSLHPKARKALLGLRQRAQAGLPRMRQSRAGGATVEDWEGDDSLKAALRFRRLVGLYSQGGVMTSDGLMDPLNHNVSFTLEKPTGWPASAGQQMDANWAISLVVDDVFPALVQLGGARAKSAARASRDLLLLANLYYLIGGYELTGPLNPLTQPLHQPLLPLARQQVREAEATVLGGSMGLGAGDNYTAFKTYNPALFELTRLFWPAKAKSGADPAWGSVLAHPGQLAGVDAVGRFGYVAKATQQVATQSRDPEEIRYRLGQLLSPVMGTTVSDWMHGRAVDHQTHRAVRAPEGFYAPFLLNWPLGLDPAGAGNAADAWLSDPLAYLKTLKTSMEQTVSRLMLTRRVGLPRSPRPPTGDMPFLFEDRPAFTQKSTLRRAEAAQQEQGVSGMIRELDKAIAKLEAKLAREKA